MKRLSMRLWTPISFTFLAIQISACSSPDPSAPVQFRFKRASWEGIFDAVKCTYKILSAKQIWHPSSKLMCCGLWKVKSILRSAALDTCDNPRLSVKVFDEAINQELVHGEFALFLLGDSDLDCRLYAEGSAECNNLIVWLYILSAVVLLVVVLGVLGAFVASWKWYVWRKSYFKLLSAHSHLTGAENKDHAKADLEAL